MAPGSVNASQLGLEEQHTAHAEMKKARRIYLAGGAFIGSALVAAVVFTTIPHRSMLSAGTDPTFAEDFPMPKTVNAQA